MNNEHHDFDDELEIIDSQDVMDAYVLDDPEHERQYLRAEWVSDIVMQLIEGRVSQGLTQRELGERMGKPQPSIARIERGDDLKLSVLWDYLAALGQAPQGRIPLVSLDHLRDRLSRYVVGTDGEGVAPIPRLRHWRMQPLTTGDDLSGPLQETGSHASGPSEEEPVEDEKVAVA